MLQFRRNSYAFMNTGTAAVPVWSLIAEGFTDFTTEMNPNENERHYIHEKTARTITSGYNKTISFEMDMYDDDVCCKRVAKVFDEEQTGSESQVEILTVKYFQKGDTVGTYFAKKQTFTISPNQEASGDGSETYILSGSFNAMGDPIVGSWDAEPEALGDGEFTPRPAAAPPSQEPGQGT
ncbi:MAG: hypothetical protein LBB86_01590 [Oscillospiraceae bacterium]|jgi:hypothetical protein|nr:hypothetical protein [Oscillospiraceae bacterium]